MELIGIGVSPGVVVGPVAVVHQDGVELPGNEPAESDPQAVRELIAETLEAVAVGMEHRSGMSSDEDARDVLQATAMIARDPAIVDEVGRQLDAGKGRLSALAAAIDHFADLLTNLGGYMAERVTDLRDVHRRAHARLLGRPEPGVPELTTPAVIVATDLAPADAVVLDPGLVLAIVTEAGGPTSHTAILSSQLGIPAVVRCEGVVEAAPSTIAVDGGTGEVVTDPADAVKDQWNARLEQRTKLQSARSGPGRTKDGAHVELLANIGTAADAEAAGNADVEGCGLFRTEFLYLGRHEAPSLEEQTATYTRVFEAMGPRKVVVRTLDSGADKPLAFASLDEEPNPALGMRGLRLYPALPELIESQLRAIAAAARATEAEVWVMAPMVATVQEAEWFVEIAHDAGLERVGAMVEVPSAAVRAEHLLGACDFVSIGTNDLSQYLFAADRLEGRLAELLDAWQPALWDLTCAIGAAGRELGKPVGMCGEASGDPLLALLAVGAGVTSLSMATAKVPMVRAALALHTEQECRDLLAATRESSCPAVARQAVRELVHPDLRQLI